MKLMAWLRKAMNTILDWLILISRGPLTLWNGVRTRTVTLLRWNRQAEPQVVGMEAGKGGQSRWQRVWSGVRRGLSLAGKGFVELWQLVKPLFGRLLRQSTIRTGLLIRKIGVKRHYRYNLDSSPLRQLLADVANALAIVVGLGAWPYQRAWFAETLPPLLAPHYWVLSALLSALPLIVFYWRWQAMRQQRTTATWDLLTISTGLLGLLLALFAGSLLFAAFTTIPTLAAALICAIIAIGAWLLGEGANAYAILIRRPRPLPLLLSLSKSLLFMLSGWLLLLYLLVVNLLAATIQLESAAFLFTFFCTTAFLGALLALGNYGLQRFNLKAPRFVSITN